MKVVISIVISSQGCSIFVQQHSHLNPFRRRFEEGLDDKKSWNSITASNILKNFNSVVWSAFKKIYFFEQRLWSFHPSIESMKFEKQMKNLIFANK